MRLDEATRALFGAFWLCRFDPRGLDFVGHDGAAAWRSFAVGLIVLPVLLLLVAVLDGPHDTVPIGRRLVVDAISFCVGWFAFLLVMDQIARALGREALWPGYVAAYNWTMAVQALIQAAALLLIGGVLAGNGVISEQLAGFLLVGVYAFVFAMQGFVAHLTLRLPVVGAVAIVLLDLMLSLFVNGAAAAALLTGP